MIRDVKEVKEEGQWRDEGLRIKEEDMMMDKHIRVEGWKDHGGVRNMLREETDE